jgi:hypothetical protein
MDAILEEYYISCGIEALHFTCKHEEDCSYGCESFTGAKASYVGSLYEARKLPRLLILSLDSGSGDIDPNRRTIKAVREIEENEYVTSELPRNKHWYRTHQIAYEVLQPFKPDLDIDNVKHYFAHVNSVKCSMNRRNRAMASDILYFNCHWYLPEEFKILDPDIVISQGERAKNSLYGAFPIIEGSQSLDYDCPYVLIEINNHPVLWLLTYHPNQKSGRYHQQWEACAETNKWSDVVRDFVANNREYVFHEVKQVSSISTKKTPRPKKSSTSKVSHKKKEATVSVQKTGNLGKKRAADEITRRGAHVTLIKGNKNLIEASDKNRQKKVTIRVKSRRKGTWQTSINEGRPMDRPVSNDKFWIFVDLSVSELIPDFYVVPDNWIRNDIYVHHQEYLQRHGGERAITKDSTHHAISLDRIEQWHDRWDILGLF